MSVRTEHIAHIEYDPDDWAELDNVERMLCAAVQGLNTTKVEFFGGCPAAGPYAEVTCDTFQEALNAHVLMREALQGKGIKVIT